MESLKQLLGYLYNVKGLIEWGGPVMVCAIIFAETGLFVGFFLPGDSLLVIAGVFAAVGKLNLFWLLVPVTLCAILGDQLGYWIGRKAGQSLYDREESRFFKKSHLHRARDFYEKHGVKTIILARFVPIVRTFCPPVTGAAQMSYTRYLFYDIHRWNFVGLEHDADWLFVRSGQPAYRSPNPLGDCHSNLRFPVARDHSGAAIAVEEARVGRSSR